MKMLIGSEERQAANGEVITVLNPATQQVVDTVPSATFEDVQEALTYARKGSREWAAVPLYRRVEIINRYARMLIERQETLAQLICAENGKPITQARGAVPDAADIFAGFAAKARTLTSECYPRNSSDRVEDDFVVCTNEPLGVVACVIPFNYPIELFAYKVAPALLMGNAVVVKPASDTPLAVGEATRLLREAGVPDNAIQLVTGSGARLGKWLCESPLVNAVSLTGSTAVGVDVMEHSAKTLKHCFLELGGNDPLIVCGDCDLDLAVQEAVNGRLPNAGQTCCSNKRLLVQDTVRDAFTEKMKAALQAARVGDPALEETQCGPVINEGAAVEVERQINLTIEQGARCLLGGRRYDKTFIQPTLLTEVTREMSIANDMEVFGPVFPIISFHTIEEAIDIANQIPYGLQGGVMTKDMKIAFQVATSLQCGCVVVNGSGNYRSELQPFGGYKMTGLGREGISETLEEMSQKKTIAFKKILAR